MKLKEIKPGIVIRCNEEQTRILQENGIVDKDKRTDGNGLWIINEIPTTSFMYSNAHGFEYIQNEFPHYKIVDFADLVETELTAEEVLKAMGEMCVTHESCGECPFKEEKKSGACVVWCGKNPDKVIKICQKWKDDHEKKEPEVKWADICQIFEVSDNNKTFVHEEDVNFMELDGSIWGSCERILKNWCKEHDGEYVAKLNRVCRVKV